MLKLAILKDITYQDKKNRIQHTSYKINDDVLVICLISEIKDFQELKKIRELKFINFTQEFMHKLINELYKQYKINYINYKPNKARNILAFEKRIIKAIDISNTSDHTLCILQDSSILSDNLQLVKDIIRICMKIDSEDILECCWTYN